MSDFWQTHGAALQTDIADYTIKHSLVGQIEELHQAIAAGADDALTQGKIRGILAEQRTFMIQFETSLDQFNAYLVALRLMDTCIQYHI